MLLYNSTRKLPEIFEKEDINQILKQILLSKDYKNDDYGEWMRHRDLCLITTIYILGLRPKEACCLKFNDFNLRNTTVKIRGTSNKNRKDRVIPVPKVLFDFYKKYFGFSKIRFWKGSPYLFPSFQNPHISPKRIEFIFREKVLKPLKLYDGKSTYTLRHSRASHILNKCNDIFAIANFLGHGDIRSTKAYLHTDKKYLEHLRKAIDL